MLMTSPGRFGDHVVHPRTSTYTYNPPFSPAPSKNNSRDTGTNNSQLAVYSPSCSRTGTTTRDSRNSQQLTNFRSEQALVTQSSQSPFIVHEDTSPAHGKKVYHRGMHWRGQWWGRNKQGDEFESDESFEDHSDKPDDNDKVSSSRCSDFCSPTMSTLMDTGATVSANAG